jgi:threonine/homoserine/homoserine lactone efflux protein
LSLGHGIIEGIYVAFIAVVLWLGREAILEQAAIAGSIALAGGVFLAWMGWQMAWGAWYNRLSLTGGTVQKSGLGLVPTGIFVSISNPYWWIWWALIATTFVGQSLVWGVGGVALLFFVHWLTDLGWLTGLSWLTATGHRMFSPSVYRWVLLVCGATLLFFGLSFILIGLQILQTGVVRIL